MLLDKLFLEDQSIFVPNEVRLLRVNVILFHASLEEPDDVTIVRILGETETSTVVHELLELLWLVLA